MQASSTSALVCRPNPGHAVLPRPPRCRCTVHAACREAALPASPVVAAPTARASLLDRLRSAAAASALAATLALAPIGPAALEAHAASVTVSNDTPVLDLARVIPSQRLEGLQQELRDLESQTGWRVRMLTRYGPSTEPSVEELRAGWNVDGRTVVVFVDPSSPNIANFKFGREVQAILHPPFFAELQSRYGNMFFVREQGESAAVLSIVDALTGCLAKGGCAVVPGLSPDHYFFTLGVSMAGGLVAGAACKLEPTGFVQRKWVWALIFSPLWATLFVSFGLGPILMRTPEPLSAYTAANTAAFLTVAVLVANTPAISRAAGLSVDDADA